MCFLPKVFQLTQIKSKLFHKVNDQQISGHLGVSLGLATYCAKFIPNFSTLSEPLRQVLRKNVKFHWLSKHQEAFDYLKQALSEPYVLAYFDLKAETHVVVEATSVGLGALVLQRQSSGDLQLLPFANSFIRCRKEIFSNRA